MRVLEGSFTNCRGGFGNNLESDLVQEHSIRHQKNLIRQLGANKTEAAIKRSTMAAGVIENILEKIDESISVKKKSSRHHKQTCQSDEESIATSLRQLRPFQVTLGRRCDGFENIKPCPFDKIDKSDMKYQGSSHYHI